MRISDWSSDVCSSDLKAKSWSLGLVYQPPAIPGFRLAADWTDVRLIGGIENLDITSLMASCYDSATYPTTDACGNFRRLTAADSAADTGTGGAPRNPADLANGRQDQRSGRNEGYRRG